MRVFLPLKAFFLKFKNIFETHILLFINVLKTIAFLSSRIIHSQNDMLHARCCFSNLNCIVFFFFLLSADDDNEDWYRYGLIAGASLALILAIIAIFGCIYQRMKFEELTRSMKKQQKRAQLSDSTVVTAIHSNQKSKNTHDLPTENPVTNTTNQKVWSVSNEEMARQGSPFTKRSRQVMPTRSNVRRGWTSQRDPDEW
jgi:hypothetical protein